MGQKTTHYTIPGNIIESQKGENLLQGDFGELQKRRILRLRHFRGQLHQSLDLFMFIHLNVQPQQSKRAQSRPHLPCFYCKSMQCSCY